MMFWKCRWLLAPLKSGAKKMGVFNIDVLDRT